MIAFIELHIFTQKGTNMEIKVSHASIKNISADVVLVDLFEGAETPSGATGAIDQALSGAISDLIRSQDLRGKLNEVTVLYSLAGNGPG